MLPTVHMDSQLLHGSTIEILWFVKLQWSTRVCINDVKYMYMNLLISQVYILMITGGVQSSLSNNLVSRVAQLI